MKQFNDRYNAQLLLEECSAEFKYVKPWGRFVVWDSHTWVQDQDESYMLAMVEPVLDRLKVEALQTKGKKAKGKALSWAEKSGNLRTQRAMIGQVKGRVECHARPNDFDQNRELLTCANGTLELETGVFRDSRPEDMLTSRCEVVYDKSATCPTWERYLSEALPDPEVRGFLKRWLGYCLTGHVKERKFVVCWGEQGNNGKSLLFGVLKALLGDKYSWNARPKLLLDNERDEHATIYASLCGKRLCMVSEIKVGQVWDEANIKLLTGGDPITCRRMHEDEWVFDPTHKLMIATNTKPRVRDTSDAFWNRLVLIPWEVSFTGNRQDTGLKDKLMDELPGILNWMVAGCEEWRKVGLGVPDQLTSAAQLYREDEDQLGAWVDQHFVFDRKSVLESEKIQGIIDAWNKINKRQYYMNTLSPRLRQKGAKPVKANGIRHWEGLRLRTPEDGEWTPAGHLPDDQATLAKSSKPFN